jgi:hypothetical protein
MSERGPQDMVLDALSKYEERIQHLTRERDQAVKHRDQELRERLLSRLDPVELALSGVGHVEAVLDSILGHPERYAVRKQDDPEPAEHPEGGDSSEGWEVFDTADDGIMSDWFTEADAIAEAARLNALPIFEKGDGG